MDYSEYYFTKKQLLYNVFLFAGIDLLISTLFYRSWIMFIAFSPVMILFLRGRKKEYIKQRKEELRMQFMEGIQAVSTALAAGYSIENAFVEALDELEKVYGEEDLIIREFKSIADLQKVNRTLEELLEDLAKRSDIEEICSFSEIFSAAKRSGGDLVVIIRNTVMCISQKEETKLEIETCVSGKKLEQRVMSIVPFFILVYVSVTSPGFLDVMYQNTAGFLIMSLCLVIYLAAYMWGKKIVDIEV